MKSIVAHRIWYRLIAAHRRLIAGPTIETALTCGYGANVQVFYLYRVAASGPAVFTGLREFALIALGL
jgi:hypothetical protein